MKTLYVIRPKIIFGFRNITGSDLYKLNLFTYKIYNSKKKALYDALMFNRKIFLYGCIDNYEMFHENDQDNYNLDENTSEKNIEQKYNELLNFIDSSKPDVMKIYMYVEELNVSVKN